MDFENNGQNVTNFMHKIKKQAKRLFQVSKNNNNNLEIKSLSQAQELLAKINGYPDWHALEKNINTSQNILQKTNEDIIKLSKFEHHQLYYLNNENTVSTFFRLSSINGSIDSIQNTIDKFFDAFDFHLNMDIYNISLVIEQTNNVEILGSYNLYNVSKDFNLTEEEAKKLFFIDKSTLPSYSDNKLSIYLLITSEKKYENEHLNLCLSINQIIPELESLPYLNKNQINNFELTDGIINNKINKKLFNKKNINKWVYLINFLTDRKLNYICKYSFANKQFIYKFNNYEKNKGLIDSFINSIVNTDNYSEQNLIYYPKPLCNYLEEKENIGLSLRSKVNNNIFNYNHMIKSRTMHVDLVYGKPGSGKSVLTNMIALSSILDKEIKNIPKIAIIDVGPSFNGTIELIKNLLPKENSNIIKSVNYGNYGKVDNVDSFHVNPFDLAFGKRVYDEDEIERIKPILLSLFANSNDVLEMFIDDILKNINLLTSKFYVPNMHVEIDKKLIDLVFIFRKDTTWWDVVDFLFLNQEVFLAKKAQTYTSVVLGDLLNLTNINREYYQKVFFNDNNIIDSFNKTIIDTINLCPKLNMPSNLIIEDEKIIAINLEDLASSMFKINNKNVIPYIYLSVLDFIKHKFLQYNQYSWNYIFPKDWKNNWTEYLKNKENNINELYHYFNYSNLSPNMNKLVIDEYHRFSHYDSILKYMYSTVRESRKNNVAMTICSQSLKDFYNIKDFSSGFFVSSISNDDELTLLDFGFTKNEINFIKTMKPLDWSIKLITNKGRYFDIVKLELTKYLEFALSTTNEDMFIKNNLENKLPYFILLNKCVEYLRVNRQRSFKYVFEEIEAISSKTKEEIVQEILK